MYARDLDVVGGAAAVDDDSKITEADLELRQPIAITIEDVLAIQTMFTRFGSNEDMYDRHWLK